MLTWIRILIKTLQPIFMLHGSVNILLVFETIGHCNMYTVQHGTIT